MPERILNTTTALTHCLFYGATYGACMSIFGMFRLELISQWIKIQLARTSFPKLFRLELISQWIKIVYTGTKSMSLFRLELISQWIKMGQRARARTSSFRLELISQWIKIPVGTSVPRR